jgi:hypothetical protein
MFKKHYDSPFVTTEALMLRGGSKITRWSHIFPITENEIFTKHHVKNRCFLECKAVQSGRREQAYRGIIFRSNVSTLLWGYAALHFKNRENTHPQKALCCFLTERGTSFEDGLQQTNNRPHRIAVKLRCLIYTSNFFLFVLIQAHLQVSLRISSICTSCHTKHRLTNKKIQWAREREQPALIVIIPSYTCPTVRSTLCWTHSPAYALIGLLLIARQFKMIQRIYWTPLFSSLLSAWGWPPFISQASSRSRRIH